MKKFVLAVMIGMGILGGCSKPKESLRYTASQDEVAAPNESPRYTASQDEVAAFELLNNQVNFFDGEGKVIQYEYGPNPTDIKVGDTVTYSVLFLGDISLEGGAALNIDQKVVFNISNVCKLVKRGEKLGEYEVILTDNSNDCGVGVDGGGPKSNPYPVETISADKPGYQIYSKHTVVSISQKLKFSTIEKPFLLEGAVSEAGLGNVVETADAVSCDDPNGTLVFNFLTDDGIPVYSAENRIVPMKILYFKVTNGNDTYIKTCL
jgi:hypothetical protein